MLENSVIDDYVRWLETLGSGGGHRIAQFVTRDARYRTPEAEGMGVNAIAAIFAGLFKDGATIKTKISDRALGQDGHTVYLRWDRLVTSSRGKVTTYSGVSELMINMDGRITSIIEHWDTVPEAPARGWFWRFLGK